MPKNVSISVKIQRVFLVSVGHEVLRIREVSRESVFTVVKSREKRRGVRTAARPVLRASDDGLHLLC